MSLIAFAPIYQERVWGGRRLSEAFGRPLPDATTPFGESWELVDRPEAQSVVVGGQYDGLSLRELCQKHGREVLSADYDPERAFPILLKWLDCSARLSLQVHPPKEIAPSLGGEPKAECWYIAQATPEAGVFAGLKKGVTREQFEEALRSAQEITQRDNKSRASGNPSSTATQFEASLTTNELEPLIHRLPTKAGDSIFIPSGRLHAIDAGNLILEIQQNSDTTYRVYDWGRPREIHVDQSLASTNFNDFEPELHHSSAQTPEIFVKDDLFTLTRHQVAAGEDFTLPADSTARILSLVAGSLEGIQPGDNRLIPFGQNVKLKATKDSTLIITSHFI